MNTLEAATTVLPENQQASKVWSSGGERYERISRQISDAIEHCVDRLDPKPGERILDVATGTGWTARRVRARGAEVAAIDFAEDVIAAARQLDPGGTIDFQIGDAEALPFEDGQFDAVISTFGVMFCGNPDRACYELARVVKPGGRIALATWAPEGGVMDMFKVIKKYVPQPDTPAPSPFDWGNPSRVRQLLCADYDLHFEEAISFYREPDAESAWDTFAHGYGPVVALRKKLAPETAEAFRQNFLAYHQAHHTGAGILIQRPYLVTCGTRKS